MIKTRLSYYMRNSSHKCTAEEISKFTGIPVGTIKDYISNKREMTLSDFVTISSYLGVSLDKLIDKRLLSYPANNIHALRIQHGLTQRELADEVGLTQPRVSALESHKYAYSNAYDLGDIAEYFGISVDSILGYIPEEIEICVDDNHDAYNDEFFQNPHPTVKNLLKYAELKQISLDSIFGFKRKGVNMINDDKNKTKRIEEKQ